MAGEISCHICKRAYMKRRNLRVTLSIVNGNSSAAFDVMECPNCGVYKFYPAGKLDYDRETDKPVRAQLFKTAPRLFVR